MKPHTGKAQEQQGPKEATYGHVLKYTSLFGGVQGFYLLMAIVRNKLTAILLGTGGIGLIDMYNRTTEFMGNATNLGLSFSAVQRIALLHERGNAKALSRYVRLVRSWTLVAAALGFVATAVAAPLLSLISLGTTRHTTIFMGLAPLVAILTLTAGEVSILKGTRRLRSIVWVTACGAVTTLAITTAIYWWLGTYGIVPALNLSAALILLLQLRCSTQRHPYRVGPASWRFMRQGTAMIRLGMAVIVAGMIASGSELLVRSFMVNTTDISTAGLYSVGFTLTVTYARFIFTAMDADFYPRLSGTAGDAQRANTAINRQIDVLAYLMGPFLIALCLAAPLLVRMLYTTDFMAAVPMVVAAVFHMYFKAVSTPIAYLALARSEPVVYLVSEGTYAAVFTVCVIAGFHFFGLPGAGAGLSAAYLAYLLFVSLYYSRHYGFRFTRATLRRVLTQLVLLGVCVAASSTGHAALKYGIGLPALLCSLAATWQFLRHETGFSQRLRQLFHRR